MRTAPSGRLKSIDERTSLMTRHHAAGRRGIDPRRRCRRRSARVSRSARGVLSSSITQRQASNADVAMLRRHCNGDGDVADRRARQAGAAARPARSTDARPRARVRAQTCSAIGAIRGVVRAKRRAGPRDDCAPRPTKVTMRAALRRRDGRMQVSPASIGWEVRNDMSSAAGERRQQRDLVARPGAPVRWGGLRHVHGDKWLRPEAPRPPEATGGR